MKNRPLIGINTDYRASAKGRALHSFMHSGYYDCLLSANAVPVMIPPLIKEHDLAPILDQLDGVLLTGGDDLDPKKMGLAPHPSVTVVPERRETSDRLLCRLVQERKMPVLGIGLGMQELNVCNGGGIYLHLPEDMPRGIPHRDPQGGPHRHTVIMEAGTRMEEDLRPGRDPGQQLPPPGDPPPRPDLPGRCPGPRRPDRGLRGERPELVGHRRAVAPRERGEHLARHAAHRGLHRGRRRRHHGPGAGQGELTRTATSSHTDRNQRPTWTSAFSFYTW